MEDNSTQELTVDQEFFRKRFYEIKGFGIALLFVIGTIALNGTSGTTTTGDSTASEIVLETVPQSDLSDRTFIFILLSLIFGAGWVIYTLRLRAKLPSHPTVDSWFETVSFCLVMFLFIAFICWRISVPDSQQLFPYIRSYFGD